MKFRGARLLCVWQDLWVGAFIDVDEYRLRVYVALIPCFPLRLTWDRLPWPHGARTGGRRT